MNIENNKNKKEKGMMFISVTIGGERIEVLLDSGASHSFISKKLVKAIPLPV